MGGAVLNWSRDLTTNEDYRKWLYT